MGWVGAISASVLLNILNYAFNSTLGVNPYVDIAVKGILIGFVTIIVKELSPV